MTWYHCLDAGRERTAVFFPGHLIPFGDGIRRSIEYDAHTYAAFQTFRRRLLALSAVANAEDAVRSGEISSANEPCTVPAHGVAG